MRVFPQCHRVLVTAAVFLGSLSAKAAGPIAPLLQPFVDDRVLPGAVMLVGDKERILDLEAVGYADVATKKPMETGDLFWIASMSKPIVASALMVLVDEGKVSLDDPVGKYLPEFQDVMVARKDGKETKLHKPAQPILIRHLLSLSGGMKFGSEMEKIDGKYRKLDGGTLAERVRSYAAMPLDFEPGTDYQYSNASLNTIGRVIEVVSGSSFEDFLAKRFFEPLGMKDTTFWPTSEQLARLARSYQGNADKSDLMEVPIEQLTYPLDDHKRQPVPAGGLFSTASDVYRFAQMILNGGELEGRRYLSETAVRAMTTKQTPESSKQGYGFGFRTNGKSFGHFGKYGTNLSIDSERGLILVFMVQNAGWRTERGSKISPTFSSAALKAFGQRRD